ncbi:MAG: hypothetical protein PHN37_01060, partial [Candidatus Pacebacteria bacterium]|nr:hypothetical protein [Candidatus Paceibacterota bacterium]
MNNFNRGSRDKARDFRRRDSFRDSRQQMHETICSNCGKRCEVPFKPTNQKPVYCRECFRDRGGDKGKFESPRGDRFQDKRENSFGNRNTDTLKKDNQYKEQLDQLIAKLDVI